MKQYISILFLFKYIIKKYNTQTYEHLFVFGVLSFILVLVIEFWHLYHLCVSVWFHTLGVCSLLSMNVHCFVWSLMFEICFWTGFGSESGFKPCVFLPLWANGWALAQSLVSEFQSCHSPLGLWLSPCSFLFIFEV